MSSRLAIACTEAGTVIATFEDGHVIRWRCRDRFCPDVQAAKVAGRGERVFHRLNIYTGEIETEKLTAIHREMNQAA